MDCGVCESTGYACDLKVDGGLSKMTLWKCNCWENRSSKEALKLSNMTLRLFEISFKKKHVIEHQLPLPAAMCFVRNHTGRLQECQTWIPSCRYQQNLRLQIQNDQIGRFFQAGRIAHIPQATQSCLWWATLARKNLGKLTTRPRNKEDLKLETTEVSTLRLT